MGKSPRRSPARGCGSAACAANKVVNVHGLCSAHGANEKESFVRNSLDSVACLGSDQVNILTVSTDAVQSKTLTTAQAPSAAFNPGCGKQRGWH